MKRHHTDRKERRDMYAMKQGDNENTWFFIACIVAALVILFCAWSYWK
jgi:hypothetical protein